MPHTQDAAGREIVSTWLPAHEAAIVRERAAAGDRSIAAELRRALRPYLTNETPAGQDEGLEKPAGQGRYAAA